MDTQERHELLSDLLAKVYKNDNGARTFRKRKKPVTSEDLHKLDVNEINSAVILIADAFNLTGGSIGGSHDFYSLLQAYILDPASRVKFDSLADDVLSKKYLEVSAN